MSPNGIKQIENIADGTGTIVQPRRALKLPRGWTIVDHPNDVLLPGPNGEQQTGYSELVMPGTSAGSSLSLGPGYDLEPGPYQQSMPGTGSPVQLDGTWTVPVGGVLTLRSKLTLYAYVATFGMLWCYLDTCTTFANAGAGVQAANASFGVGASVVPPFDTALVASVSGNVVTATISPLTIPAWAPLTAYVGSTLGGGYGAPNPPTAIMGASTGCSVVSHASLLYACTAGGTSAASGGPTGTGSGIVDGTATWACLNLPASGGLPYTFTMHMFEVLWA
ncbi:MAG TPA: hypothetical protein VLT47_14235 [Anaeromyxobacteraceae bacterium]|nr:hypothetical protein [Anaeromyxobacteraceae bacterium]